MIPLGRSIPNLPGPAGGSNSGSETNLSQGQQSHNPAEFNPQRRRSSIDAILGHLKYVGQFPSRVMQDLNQPLSSIPRPDGTIGQLGLANKLRSQSSSMSLGGSSTDLGSMSDLQQKQTAPSTKLPTAEMFLSGV